VSWIEVVGYQHEVVHTGVLSVLLTDASLRPGPAAIASELINADVVSIDSVKRESRAGRGAGIADLTASVMLADGSSTWLAVETKVNSNGKREQLLRTLPGGGFGVLLALGLTSLKMSPNDTTAASRESSWTFVGPARWAALLGGVDPVPEYLGEYVAEVARRADYLDEALRLAAAGAPARDGEGRAADHIAWLSLVRADVDDPSLADWGPIKTDLSGPLLTGFVPRLHGVDVYVELMGLHDGSRRLCVKCGSAPTPQALVEVVETVQSWTELGLGDGGRPRRGSTLD
jgi:hypothetical protein